jgi:hypothetical protein
MDILRPRTKSGQTERSIGTLWTLRRGESTARCTLLVSEDGLQVRVSMDDAPLRSERCDTHQHSFELADRWRSRMMERGWSQVVPQGWSGPVERLR